MPYPGAWARVALSVLVLGGAVRTEKLVPVLNSMLSLLFTLCKGCDILYYYYYVRDEQ
jgi:hypothetical protein